MKQDYRIKIQLISDLCVSDGSVYNSAIDTDVCYDDNGFPYIPAKRIKGCLRECAMELKDWGISIDISGIFGKEGNKKSSLRLENAYLKDYGKYKEEVECAGGHVLVHPQNVLRCFTYVRSQTALDYETGVAEASSLRTMRVIKKGLEFIAPVKIEEKYKDELKKCCTIWKHMGIARTRGFGEISVCLEETEEVKGQKEHIKWTDGAERLVYQLELEEPVICKSVNGQEENTLDYIEGSKMLGFLAQNLKREKGNQGFYDYMNMGEVYCSNAYICENDQRLSEVPGTYYSIKNEEDKYVDKIYEKEANRKDVEKAGIQLNQMKHCYVGKDKEGKLIKRNVMVEERYHHRRPDDKSIGRAVEENAKGHETENRTQDSKFYQMSSIRQGQTFQGFIQGTKEQIEKAYSCLKGCDTMQIGYSRSAEYGKVRFRITELKPLKETERRTKQVVAILQAPAIIYNEKATYATNIKELEQEIAVELGIDGEYETTQSYVKYTTVGGFQVTWGRRKPTLEAFDKGTVVIFHLKEEKNLGIKDTYWIGERVQEGFGEMRVEIPDEKGTYENQLQKETAQTVENLELKEFTFLPEIARNLLESYMKVEAVKKAKKLVEEKKWKKNVSCKPTINNMLSMCKECNCIKDIEDCIQERFGKISCNKPEKNKIATAILKQVKEEFEKGEIDVILLERFYQRFGLSPFYVEEKEIEKQEIKYLQFCLLEIKYALRRGDVEDGAGD